MHEMNLKKHWISYTSSFLSCISIAICAAHIWVDNFESEPTPTMADKAATPAGDPSKTAQDATPTAPKPKPLPKRNPAFRMMGRLQILSSFRILVNS